MSEHADSFDGMPARFDYVRPAVERYARRDRNHDENEWRRSLAALPPADLRDLADVYERLDHAGDADALLAWIHTVQPEFDRAWYAWLERSDEAESRGLPEPPEPPRKPKAAGVFELFSQLGRLGRQPFSSDRVRWKPPAPDWSGLPEGCQYVIEPATRWGRRYQHYWPVEKLRNTIPADKLDQLTALDRRLRESGDWDRVAAWASGRSPVKDQAAILVNCLFGVLKVIVPPAPRG